MTVPDPNRGSPDAVLLIVAWVCQAARVVGVMIVVLLLLGSIVLLYR